MIHDVLDPLLKQIEVLHHLSKNRANATWSHDAIRECTKEIEELSAGKLLKGERTRTRLSQPTTLEQAAQVLIRDMTPYSRKMFASLKDDDLLGQSRSSLGDYCRQYLGLDGRNIGLLLDCGAKDFEDAVRAVIRRAWDKARAT